jgi:hypothetical protein
MGLKVTLLGGHSRSVLVEVLLPEELCRGILKMYCLLLLADLQFYGMIKISGNIYPGCDSL